MSGGSQIFFGAATPACWTVIYYLKLKCISKRVVSWYQGLVQVRKGQLADNCNHNINIGVGPLILLYLFQM